ncbi:M23 family metallopeptidase [Devosia rhodophyticola]|uniref:M23 family metallopeptidase n=1 Tax=Devosia rhodophyticola TaxID=3026423 RepID=A0ABY7YWZ4_9HYPH|nr:M23 family metallopeptidase [Devosia rhodophyticola]WDR05761.1 M23 family metallopeptidase [Devosia rhodophyticola]
MSIRVSLRAHKSAIAIAGVMASAVALSGCTAIGGRAFSDPTVTGSTNQYTPGNINQPMPASLGAPAAQVADARFLPPQNVGYGGGQAIAPSPAGYAAPMAQFPSSQGGAPTVTSHDLPVLNSSTGNQQTMSAQQSFAPAAVTPPTAAMGSLPINSATPTMAPVASAAASGAVFRHTIAGGESLYTIARRYDVTTQSIVQANNLGSPDRIVVGQQIIIPGRADLIGSQMAAPTPAPTPAPALVASAAPHLIAPTPAGQRPSLAQSAVLAPKPAAAQPVVTAPVAAPQAAPVQQASIAPREPQMSGSDKFRWPVSGRVITDFAASKATGINIEVPEGASVKSAENGTVIYVGSGVEGYGNLVLIRHPNGYVSAYAHLKSMSVAKGAVVNRGDAIGAAGMTGSVSKPQLHFELRKGATPVDPVPLLAG